MKIIYLISLITLTANVAFSQSPEEIRTYYNLGTINVSGNGGMFNIMSSKPTETLGTYYYNDKYFKKGFISVEGLEKPLGEYRMRYNLKTNELEVILKEGLRSISTSKINNFLWSDSISNRQAIFLKASNYTYDGSKIDGFLEVIQEGKLSLLKRKKIRLQKSNFNPLLVEESTNDQIFQDEEFFLLKNNNIIKLEKKNKKSITAFLADNERALTYLKNNKVNYKKESELNLFIIQCNSK
jgi:hypothetical protein